ncbi:MAG: UDP-galactopyranose mutase [Coriobacteriales bacterium]|nr:UDP-galactopyranose mutase [Coriobacteriales bacterium]
MSEQNRGAPVACDALIVGAGFAGSVIARELAERGGMRVALIEMRAHIGGNAYDCLDETGVLIHTYGPHIYHTASERVHEWLTRFTAWRAYEHKVLANVHGQLLPVPFSLSSIEAAFAPDRARQLTDLLKARYGLGARVPIIELRKAADPLLHELADYVYENIFLQYTMKQWGSTPEQIDPLITARVPVLVDYDDRYFQDPWQGMPCDGYTALFEKMLDHPNITVHLGYEAREIIAFEETGTSDAPFTAVRLAGQPFEGLVIYTGALDELAEQRFGLLPYRTLDLVYRHYDRNPVQAAATINFTVSEAYTRTTEFTWLTAQDIALSTVLEEYSLAYDGSPAQTAYYPIVGKENQERYERYRMLFTRLSGFHPLGRLAEYRYYNMDQIVLRALELADDLLR